jgi:hypothetical protein
MEWFSSNFLEQNDSRTCLVGRTELLYFLFGCRMRVE